MKQFAFSLNVSLCSGCMACVVACQDQNDFISEGVAYRYVRSHEEGRYPTTRVSFSSIACSHCGDAPCQMVCPSGAIYKREDNGIVDLHKDLCVGCHSCELACPFGAPKFAEDGKMVKCDMCRIRVFHDLDPACVRICTTNALTVEPIEEISDRKAEKACMTILQSLINR